MTEPRITPIQKVEPMTRLAVPRTRAGISSSMAEVIAVYSPPMPAPVSTRHSVKVARFQENAVAAVEQTYSDRVQKKSLLRPYTSAR